MAAKADTTSIRDLATAKDAGEWRQIGEIAARVFEQAQRRRAEREAQK